MTKGVPSSAVFHRSQAKSYATASGGEGVYLKTKDGKLILDGSSGAAVSCLGHGHQRVIQAIIDQAQRMAFAHSSFFTSDPAEELATLLLGQSQGAFTKVMLLSSVESALKLARQYHLCIGQPDRVKFIGRQYSYHGNTLGALSAGFNPPRRRAFEPMLSSNFHHVSPCFYSRDMKQNEDESHYVQRLLDEYEDTFNSLGPQTVAAVIVEPVGGATLGSVSAADGYLPGLKRLCEKHGALLIFDEVMCRMGRIGSLHAWQSLGGVAPDLQTVGKGLGAGYQPISGILVSPKVHKAIEAAQDSSPLISGHTYQGHSIGCAAALAVQQTIVEENLLKNVQDMGIRLEKLLKATVPHLREVRGHGLFITAEFQSNPSGPLAPEVSSRCLQNGAAVYLCSSAVDAILFAPAFIITSEEVEQLVNIFVLSVNQVLLERGLKSK